MSDIIQSTTQQFLDIYDITNNFVVMKDGTVSTILTVDAMNFGLLAEEEQDAIMYAYAGLLNSLNYPIQIIINSRTKDVTSYLKVLQEQETTAENETLRRRIRMYREFVGNLIHERNVLDKKFYVVIPAAAVEMGFLAPASVLPGKTSQFDVSSIERSVIIEKAQNLLDPKRDHLIAQFARIGLFSRQLTTQEIIQLFYVRYNPEAVEGQQIGESSSYTTPLVKASIQGNFMNTPIQTVPQPQTAPEEIVATSPPITQTPVESTTIEPVVQTYEQSVPEPISSEAHLEPVPEIHVAAATQPPMEQVAPQMTAPVSTPPVQAVAPTPMPEIVPVAPTLPATPTVPTIISAPGAQTPPPGPKIPEEVIAPTPQIPVPTSPALQVDQTTPTQAAPVAPLEKDVQADLNATLQSLGTVPAESSAGSTQPASDLPPLPEI